MRYVAVLFIVSFLILDFFFRSSGAASNLKANKNDEASTRAILVGFACGIIVPPLVIFLSIGNYTNSIVAITGMTLSSLGVLIRIYSMRELAQFYTRTLKVVEQHKLITSRLYKLIRHPGYLGTLMVWLGILLIYQNWLSLIVVYCVLLYVYRKRIHQEEVMMLNQFGAQYTNYKERSKKLIPYIY